MRIAFSAIPTFADPLTIEIEHRGGRGAAVLEAVSGGTEKSDWQVTLDEIAFQRLAAIATSLPPPPIPIEGDELDGTQYRVEIRSDDRTCRYEWWDNVPPGWERVGELVDELLRLAGPRAKLAGIW